MKKLFKYAAACLVAVALIAFLGLTATTETRRASAAPDALAALASDARVEVTDGDWLVFRPARRTPIAGVIFYPGANCDVRGYAPVLRPLAEQGYLVVDVRMPFDLAVLAPHRALAVQKAFPEIHRWVLIGHSIGGAMAGQFAHDHGDTLAGLVIWDSYPSASLAESRLPVWHVHRATLDGAPPPSFAAQRGLYPRDSPWLPIRGGVHMYFGSFVGGAYKEQWVPRISREAQHEQVIAATLGILHAVAPDAAPQDAAPLN